MRGHAQCVNPQFNPLVFSAALPRAVELRVCAFTLLCVWLKGRWKKVGQPVAAEMSKSLKRDFFFFFPDCFSIVYSRIRSRPPRP